MGSYLLLYEVKIFSEMTRKKIRVSMCKKNHSQLNAKKKKKEIFVITMTGTG